MLSLYTKTCAECSRLITHRYSTSFSMGIRAFDKDLRPPIYAIYGFVRFADEIVDTFHQYNKAKLLAEFKDDAFKAIKNGISLNPVLHSFQEVVNTYNIPHDLIEAFIDSMEMDLHESSYERSAYDTYIYGSAEVVGLMCLRVFCRGEDEYYDSLKEPARRLGSAFQKVNFLRDMGSDFEDRGRVYFPNVDFEKFSANAKQDIEAEIKADFDAAYEGITRLPNSARFGVYLAYVYYVRLFEKIRKSTPDQVVENRIRVADSQKIYLLFQSAVKNRLKMI